jgi:NAD(P)-dependent dehydrogenase (short-subunit alcohol dehydrogenase family)
MSGLFDYSGKRVVVTGGYSGLGAALISVLRSLDVEHVTVLDIKEPANADRFIATNMGSVESVDAAISAIDDRVDVLFNNAGVAANQGTRTVMSVNYLGARHLAAGLLSRIPAGGAIVNTASMAGNGWPANVGPILELLGIAGWDESLSWIDAHSELVADCYAFSKQCAQVQTMLMSHATIAVGVRTNSVCPGPVQTPLMTDFRATMGEKVIDWTVTQQGINRLAVAEDIAPVMAFLGSEASGFMNGTNLLADGGFTAAMTTGQVDFSGLA